MAYGARVNWNFNMGATWTLGPFQILDSSGNPVAISACSGKMRLQIGSTAAAATFSCTVTDPTNGIAQAVLSATTTAALVPTTSTSGNRDTTQYFYDINVTLQDGVTVLDVLWGNILMEPTCNY